jgi:hypothetical protein
MPIFMLARSTVMVNCWLTRITGGPVTWKTSRLFLVRRTPLRFDFSPKRYTLEEQQRDHSGDLLFEFLPSLKDAKVVWGGEQVRTGHENTTGLGNSTTRTEVMRPFGIPVYRYD